MVRLIQEREFCLINDDPVRPHISVNSRLSNGREVYVLDNENTVDAVICVAYTNEVPTTEQELDLFSQQACQDDQHGNIAIFYTVWSYSKGAGRTIVLDVANHIKKNKPVTRFVTLSPKTEMAEKFHLSNGAFILAKNPESNNFEYNLT